MTESIDGPNQSRYCSVCEKPITVRNGTVIPSYHFIGCDCHTISINEWYSEKRTEEQLYQDYADWLVDKKVEKEKGRKRAELNPLRSRKQSKINASKKKIEEGIQELIEIMHTNDN